MNKQYSIKNCHEKKYSYFHLFPVSLCLMKRYQRSGVNILWHPPFVSHRDSSFPMPVVVLPSFVSPAPLSPGHAPTVSSPRIHRYKYMWYTAHPMHPTGGITCVITTSQGSIFSNAVPVLEQRRRRRSNTDTALRQRHCLKGRRKIPTIDISSPRS